MGNNSFSCQAASAVGRMANNLQRLKEWPTLHSTNMNDWLTNADGEVEKIVEFLRGTSATTKAEQEAVRILKGKMKKEAFVGHRTQAIISKKERVVLLDNLAKDPVLGPILDAVRELIP